MSQDSFTLRRILEDNQRTTVRCVADTWWGNLWVGVDVVQGCMKACQGTEVTGQLRAPAVLSPGKGKESLAPVEGSRWILPVAWSLFQLSYPSRVEVMNVCRNVLYAEPSSTRTGRGCICLNARISAAMHCQYPCKLDL